MAEIDTSIYRQQPQQNPLDTIVRTGQAADALGGIAVGDAMQGALNPQTGEIDRNKLGALLRQTNVGAQKILPTLQHLEQLRQAGFAADQAGLETFQKRMAITHHLFSGLASKERPTIDDVYDIASKALDPGLNAKKYGITMPVIMNALKQFRGPDGKPLSSEQIRQKALQIQTQAATTSEILSQHTPQMQIVDRGGNLEFVPAGTREAPATGTVVPKNLPPGAEVATPQGKRYLGEQPPPAPAAVRPGGGGGLGPPPVQPAAPPGATRVPTTSYRQGPSGETVAAPTARGPAASLPPGQSEAYTAIGGASGRSAVALTDANDTSMTRKAMLGNLEDDLRQFTSGKGADWSRIAKNFINRNIPVPKSWQEAGAVLDPKSVASQEQFVKQATMLAQQQFSAIGGTGTDAKFNSTFETSPNETLSQLGNQGIIRLLKGNEDAIQAKNKAWRAWLKGGNGPDTYPEFSADFNEKFDPRAFQFKYLSKDERQAYIDGMEEGERIEFLRALTHARKEGWVKFDQPKAK